MSNSYFDDDKLKYENIEIPEELDFMVKKTLKEGREKRRFKTIYKYGIGIVSTFLVFVLLVNIFPITSYSIYFKFYSILFFLKVYFFDKPLFYCIIKSFIKSHKFY